MNQETRQCQNCKADFFIEPEDFKFYEKMQVPAPTWCPECRFQRRLLVFNERSFYTRNCDMCKKNIISIFPQENPRLVYCPPCCWSDKWEPMDYGREYDFSRPFFTQVKELFDAVPEFGLQNMYRTLINSDYINMGVALKDCYLTFNSAYNERCAYSRFLTNSKDSLDMYLGDACELCFEGTNIGKSNHVLFCADCQNCVDVYFSKNLRGCNNCFGCVNLRNKAYYIFNKPYSKKDYHKEIEKFNLGSYKAVSQIKEKVEKLHITFPRKYMEGVRNVNVSGNYINNSKNAFSSYDVVNVEDSKFCQFVSFPSTKDAYDMTLWGGGASRIYECMGAGDGEDNIKFSIDCWAQAKNIEYCRHILMKNSDLFGCGALRNKQYCILNKQYTKSEYEKLLPKVIEHMNSMPYIDSRKRVYKYGEFFPPEHAMFAYNETIAQEHFPLTKDEAKQKGYLWKEVKAKEVATTISYKKLPDHIKDVPASIIKEFIACQHEGTCQEQCTIAFRIIPQELKFYKTVNLPLPRLCPNCRHYQRLKKRNPFKLWQRKCTCAGAKSEKGVYKNEAQHFHKDKHCPNEFETSYAPERKEIVYCEKCYLAEVN